MDDEKARQEFLRTATYEEKEGAQDAGFAETCLVCDLPSSYNEEHKLYFCDPCDVWLDQTCGFEECCTPPTFPPFPPSALKR